MKRQGFLFVATVVLLSGCATTTSSTSVQPERPTATEQSQSQQPCSALRELDYTLYPHRYQHEFEECDAAIKDEALTENYLWSLALTGHFEQLHSSTLFATLHMDAQQSQQWRLWIEENHL